MYGLEYYRYKKRFGVRELGKLTGINPGHICRLQFSMSLNTSYSLYERIANVLGVTVDDLFEEFPYDAVGYGDHRPNSVCKDNPYNCIAHYRWEHNLVYRELAEILGLKTDSGAQNACAAGKATMWHVETLARREGMTPGTFLTLYREGELL